jgi:glycerol uptake facilitator-like aquaporin
VVTLSEAWQKHLPAAEVLPYVAAQVVGAFAGVAAAHGMFGEPVFLASEHVRTGVAQWWSEGVATFGLIAVIIACSRTRAAVTPFAVGMYITAAYWFTSSTSFANPAVTLARSATNTFAGIRPIDAPGFIVAQLLGGAAATLVMNWMYPASKTSVVPAAPPEAATVAEVQHG